MQHAPMSPSANLLLLVLFAFLVADSPAAVHGQRFGEIGLLNRFVAGQQSQQNVLPPLEHKEGVNTVRVRCHPGFMEITVKADLFAVGAPVAAEELRLGPQSGAPCSAVASNPDEYTITAGLSDCGTRHWMSREALIYTNLLVFSPAPSADGLIRMEEAVVPVECHYMRKYSLSSLSVSPTWIPFTDTQSAIQTLAFDLKIMTSDWQYEHGTKVFFLGEPISIEASVRTGYHMDLRVFLSSCVATLDPDRQSIPRYVFIQNDGCLVDSQIQGSRSQFNPRIQDNKLQLVLDAFRFHKEDRGELYITCLITASPVTHQVDSHNKACSFLNGRWRSADDNDYMCGYCQDQSQGGLSSQNEAGQEATMPRAFMPRGFGKPQSYIKPGTKTVWEHEAAVGPVLVLPHKHKVDGPIPEEELPPLLAKMSRPILYGSKWRSGIDATPSSDDQNETGSSVDSSTDGATTQTDLQAEQDLQEGDVFVHLPADLKESLVLDELLVTEMTDAVTTTVKASHPGDSATESNTGGQEDPTTVKSGTKDGDETSLNNTTTTAKPVPTTAAPSSNETKPSSNAALPRDPVPLQKGNRTKTPTPVQKGHRATTPTPVQKGNRTKSHTTTSSRPTTALPRSTSQPPKNDSGPS